MALAPPVPPPFKTPMVGDADQIITRPWMQFFMQLFAVSPGGPSVPGSELLLSVPGTLAIKSAAAPLVSLFVLGKPSECVCLVKTAPVGGNIVVQLKVDATVLCTVTILAGATSGSATITAAIPASLVLTADITSVGLTFGGADLSILLRF